MEAEHLAELRNLQGYLSQPAFGKQAVAVHLEEISVDRGRLQAGNIPSNWADQSAV